MKRSLTLDRTAYFVQPPIILHFHQQKNTMKKKYFQVPQTKTSPNASTWGIELPKIVELIHEKKTQGSLLNVACGDGRYLTHLAKNIDKITCIDYDDTSLVRAKKILLDNNIKTHCDFLNVDILKPLPFGHETFDIAFCSGTLHLFNAKELDFIFDELHRVLKKGATFIYDFSYNIKRQKADGSLILYPNEPSYTTAMAKETNEMLARKFSSVENIETFYPETKIFLDEVTYTFSASVSIYVFMKR